MDLALLDPSYGLALASATWSVGNCALNGIEGKRPNQDAQ
jgi:hypothetical protein